MDNYEVQWIELPSMSDTLEAALRKYQTRNPAAKLVTVMSVKRFVGQSPIYEAVWVSGVPDAANDTA